MEAIITAVGVAIVGIIGAIGKIIIDLAKVKNQTDIEFQKAILRAEILNIYFDYRDSQQIPESQYQACLQLYDVYKSLGGNSYVDEKVEKLKTFTRW